MTHELLKDFPVIYKTQVIWSDMDAFQHVNNSVYLRYFESARIHYFEHTPAFEILQTTGIGPIVHSHYIRYRFPLTYPDEIHIGVRVTGVGEDRISVAQRLVSTRHNVISAEADTTIVFFDYRQRVKSAIPASVLQAFDRLEGWQPDNRPEIG